MASAVPGRSIYDYPEFYLPNGDWNPKYNYLLEIPYWDTARADREIRAAIDAIQAAQLKAYNEQSKQDMIDYANAIKEATKDPLQVELEASQKQAAAAAAAQQASIDAYNAAEKKRLEKLYKTKAYSPAMYSWFERANADVVAAAKAAAAAPPPAPPAADVAAEAIRQAQQLYDQRLKAALTDNNARLVQDEAEAAAARQATAAAAAAAAAGALDPSSPQQEPISPLSEAFDLVIRIINWR